MLSGHPDNYEPLTDQNFKPIFKPCSGRCTSRQTNNDNTTHHDFILVICKLDFLAEIKLQKSRSNLNTVTLSGL